MTLTEVDKLEIRKSVSANARLLAIKYGDGWRLLSADPKEAMLYQKCLPPSVIQIAIQTGDWRLGPCAGSSKVRIGALHQGLEQPIERLRSVQGQRQWTLWRHSFGVVDLKYLNVGVGPFLTDCVENRTTAFP